MNHAELARTPKRRYQHPPSATPKDNEAMLKLLRKPRTSSEMAERLSLPVSVVAARLGILEADGRVKRAEMIGQYQIWELAR